MDKCKCGAEIPDDKECGDTCDNCGEVIYMGDGESEVTLYTAACKTCGEEIVCSIPKMRDHLEGHNAAAHAFDAEDVLECFEDPY